MAIPILDDLFCEEQDQWDDHDDEDDQTLDRDSGLIFNHTTNTTISNGDLLWDDDELLSLFTNERETQIEFNPNLSIERILAVDWVVRVNTHYGFAPLTAILAVNYFDRFVSSVELQREEPWMMQLAAVTCLSLAAKVEETRVPLLLDLQVEGAKHVFEAKIIQRMELLVLSTLKWKMNPVTPLSFIDHITRRMGSKFRLQWEFLRQCETLLLSVIFDSRFVGYLPSVLATATMLHVIQQVVEPCNYIDYQNQLLCVLNLTWEKVNDCYQLVLELISNTSYNLQRNKCKHEQISTYLSSSSVDKTVGPRDSRSNGPSVTSSSSSPPEVHPHKKIRVSEQRLSVPSLARVFVAVIGNPR